MPLGECSGAFVAWFARQLQNTHARVVIVHHTALRRLPDQLVQHLSHPSCGCLYQFPLCRCRQRHPQLPLQLFQALKRHPGAVLQQSDHRHRRHIILVRTRILRFGGGEDLAAGIAAQSLHLVHRCSQRRLPCDPHQRGRFLLAVYSSLMTFRARVAGVERGMRNPNPVCARKHSRAVASVADCRRLIRVSLLR